MKKNEGTLDRILRVALGLALLSLTVIGPKSLWGLVGIVPLLTLRDPLILHAPASFRNLSGIYPIHRCYRGHEDLISPPPPARSSSPDEEVAVRSHRAPRQTARSGASSGCV